MLPQSSSTQNCHRTQKEVSTLIKELRDKGALTYSGPHKASEIDAIEKMYMLRLPSEYRQFLANYGLLAGSHIAILGLEDRNYDVLSLEIALQSFRLVKLNVPPELCPIEFLEDKSFACLVCDLDQKTTHAPIGAFKLHEPSPVTELRLLANCFRDYLYDRLLVLKEVADGVPDQTDSDDEAWKNFEWHVSEYHKKYEYDHAKGGKLPRNHDWRPYRYCIQDVVFGLLVVAHNREGNWLDVDVFLTSEVPEYGPLAGAQALTNFLLSEAYKCGGTMEIRFTKNVEGGQVPKELQELAVQYGVIFHQADKGIILPREARYLYALLTNFSPSLLEKIEDLEQIGQIKMARACYVVHHGVWTREQVEMIVLGSQYPDSILAGSSQPHQRHRYHHDVLHARSALLAGMLDRTLARRERISEDGTTYDMEDDVRSLEITFDGVFYAKCYRCDDDISVPWLYPEERSRQIPGGMPFHVLIRARDVADMAEHMANDVEQAKQLRKQTNAPVFLLAPYDFVDLDASIRQYMESRLGEAQIGLLVCPESLAVFDNEAAQKLARSRILRQ